MTTYGFADLVAAAIRAGFPPDAAQTAGHIAQAESGGRTEATNNNPPVEYSVGPWQINLLAHPNVTEECARDLDCAARYAYSLWQNQGFQPWSVYTQGLVPIGPGDYVQAGFPSFPDIPTLLPPFFGNVIKDFFGLFGKLGIAGFTGDAAKVIAEIFTRIIDILKWITNPASWFRLFFIGVGLGAVVLGLRIYGESAYPEATAGIKRAASLVVTKGAA